MIKNANTDLIAGVIGILITILFWFSIDPDVSDLSIMFPRAMVVILGLLAAALVVKGLVKAQRADMFADGNNIRWIVISIMFFVWIIAITYIGFWVSTVVGISVIVYYLSLARRKASLPEVMGWVGIVTVEVSLFYLVFTRLLHVPLPTGLLF